MHPTGVGTWTGDWAWSLPLIVLTVVIHVCGLAVIGESVVKSWASPSIAAGSCSSSQS